ncbi:MAG: CarD family transcriptional regulator [Candidatus Gracilibacteria bacterium]|nr:CarD family transcriptional regulator [Candidatus Gracilibacteria bacterium]
MHYLNTGNIFSKSLLIKEYLNSPLHLTKKNELINSLIVTKAENIKKYLNIFLYLNIPLTEITCLSQFIDFVYNSNGNFIVNYDLVFAKLPNNWEIENKNLIKIERNKPLNIDLVVKNLTDFGYKFREHLDGGDYKKTGDTLSIKVKNKKETIIISFWGDNVENIFLENGINSKEIENIIIGKIDSINYFALNNNFNNELTILLKQKHIVLDNIDILEGAGNLEDLENILALDILKDSNINQINLDITDLFIDNIENLIKLLKSDKKISIYTKNEKTILKFLEYNNISNILVYKTDLTILKSFKSSNEIVICDDNLSKIFVKKRVKKSLSENLDLLLQIKPGDFVVHIEHGIGIFKGIIYKELGKIKKEYLEIEYKNNDKLFVPITEVRRVSKYIGNENPTLTGLSTKEWSKKLEKVAFDVQKVAEELLEIYASRKISNGFAFKYDEIEMIKFARSFDFEYTPDQVNAIDEIMNDMSKSTPMERILVGDVGFGKTEIAFNAVYNAFLNKKQSIIISPLVVLAYEHYNKAIERFSSFPINIEVLTRFETESQARIILKKLQEGKIDLIIGTHRLLGEKIKYKDLGLLIIDEEHKFGVQDKEKIKEMKGNIDILSMSATPIPRSLNMALNGVRDVSILSKAPSIRKGVETFVSKFDDNIIKQAGEKEFERGGQLFFIHNRVDSIDAMQEYLQNLFPKRKIIITHGQLHGNELEDRILAFKKKEYDILLSSTVIENGIDFANVNTIIINDAYKFGISQIHQLRGRVGRSDKVGYCYLLFKKEKISPDAAKRLTTVVEYSHLGAGFELAIRDLEIRGGGDILGLKQSGMSSEIGINTYLKLLEDKIEELKMQTNILQESSSKNKENKRIETTIDLNISAYLGDNFFDSELDKINFYREIESIGDLEELENLICDFSEFSGELKEENKNLFKLLEIRIVCSNYKIKSIKRSGVSYEINFVGNLKIDELKSFLDLDKDVKLVVNSITCLKCSCQKFSGDLDFLNYLYQILIENKNTIKAIKKFVKLKK